MPRVVPSQIVSFIDHQFPYAATAQPGSASLAASGGLSTVLSLIDELPSDLLTVSGDTYNDLVNSVESIRTMLAIWTSRGSTVVGENNRMAAAVTRLRSCLSGLPDQQVPAATAGLSFIRDTDLRESIRRDIASAEQALRDAEWKGATVIGGAVIEALLLWAINERPLAVVKTSLAALKQNGQIQRNVHSDPNTWALETYKKIAAHLGIISGDTMTLVELTQGFRNLIHPGKAIRTGTACNRSTALTTIAAVERLVENFSP